MNVRIIAAVNEDPEGLRMKRNKIRGVSSYRSAVCCGIDIPELYRRKLGTPPADGECFSTTTEIPQADHGIQQQGVQLSFWFITGPATSGS